MTNEEAIEYIKLIFVRDRANELHFISHDEEIALNLAIEALKEKDLRERMKKLYYQELRKEGDNNGTGRGD